MGVVTEPMGGRRRWSRGLTFAVIVALAAGVTALISYVSADCAQATSPFSIQSELSATDVIVLGDNLRLSEASPVDLYVIDVVDVLYRTERPSGQATEPEFAYVLPPVGQVFTARAGSADGCPTFVFEDGLDGVVVAAHYLPQHRTNSESTQWSVKFIASTNEAGDVRSLSASVAGLFDSAVQQLQTALDHRFRQEDLLVAWALELDDTNAGLGVGPVGRAWRRLNQPPPDRDT